MGRKRETFQRKRARLTLGDCGGIVPLSTVGKTFCKILDHEIGTMVEKDENISELRAGFRPKRGCIDHVHIRSDITQSGKGARLITYCF